MENYKNTNLEKLNNEIWLDLKDYEGIYQVSNFGRVKVLPRIIEIYNSRIKKYILYPIKEKIFKQSLDSNGYPGVCLTKNKKELFRTVHRLVALTFIPNPENKKEVNHINGIKTDNRFENLEWNTTSENQIHSYENGLQLKKYGKDRHTTKYKFEIFDLDNNFIRTIIGLKEMKEFNLKQGSINNHKLNEKFCYKKYLIIKKLL